MTISKPTAAMGMVLDIAPTTTTNINNIILLSKAEQYLQASIRTGHIGIILLPRRFDIGDS